MVSQAARKNLEAHIQGEAERDMEALMAPLSDSVRYVIPNYVLEGKAAIEAMYERAMPVLTRENSDEYLRALDDPAVARWGENHCVLEYTDDYPLHRGMVVVIHFDGDKVKSENTYFTSAGRLQEMTRDEDFEKVPGVTYFD